MTSDGRRLDFDISALAAAGGTLEQANDMTLVQCNCLCQGPSYMRSALLVLTEILSCHFYFFLLSPEALSPLWQPPAHDHDDGRRLGFACSGVRGEVRHGTRATLAGCQQ